MRRGTGRTPAAWRRRCSIARRLCTTASSPWSSANSTLPRWSTSSARCRATRNPRSRRVPMISVSKIAHASYETPDLDKQTEYYTEVLGLTVAAKEKDAVYLASTVDHHSVVLRKGANAQ